MFTNTITIKFIGLDLKESMEVLDHVDVRSRLQKGWFDILEANVNAGNIKYFRYHVWDPENQTITATYYSDSAEQSRIFRHGLLENSDFMSFVNLIQGKGHEMSIDMGLSGSISEETIAIDPRYQRIKYSL